jgi:MinD-like ATPase involved in chromosome partitioning or flagellar assembly
MERIIPLINFKGGTGKSTVCAMCQEGTSDSIVLNIDLAQYAEEINYGAAIDLSDILSNESEKTVVSTIDELLSEYQTVFIDTPGEQTEEVVEMLEYFKDEIKTIIIPVLAGRRSIDATISTIFFLYQEKLIKKGTKIIFIINRYNKESVAEDAEKNIKEKLEKNNLKNEFKFFFTKLKNSDTIITMEDTGCSIEELKSINFVAYKTFSLRIKDLIRDLKQIMEK